MSREKARRSLLPLGDALAACAELERRLVFVPQGPPFPAPAARVVRVGSVRRRAPEVGDLDLLVVLPRAWEPRIGEVLAAARFAPRRRGDRLALGATLAVGARQRRLACRVGGRAISVDLFAATRAERPFALFHLTGPREYNIRTRAAAKRRGWRLNQYGLFRRAPPGAPVPGAERIRTEKDLALFLGLQPRAPAARGAEPAARGPGPAARAPAAQGPRPARGPAYSSSSARSRVRTFARQKSSSTTRRL
ncbi:MAG TPA: hypothetical protein VNI01_06880 [Elusimicrobiota bacterium]|nr:hypothetical protein [Elusimicrobiota bacterium]